MAYPYQKHTWVTKEIIRREYLQNIEDGIYDEQQDRLAQEATLRQSISDEESRAKRAELQLTNDLGAEVTRATGIEGDLSDAIAAEVLRATGVEGGFSDDISSLSGRITDEANRALGVESNLSNALSAEVTRATGVEAELRSSVTRAYKASGSIYFADLPAPIESRNGNVYNIKDDFTTTSDFVEGAGKAYPSGSNVAIEEIEGDYYNEVTPEGTENPSEEGWYVLDDGEYVLTADTEVVSGTTYYEYSDIRYMYDVTSGFIDTSDFITNTDYATLLSAGIVKPDGSTVTVDADGTLHSSGGGHGSAEAAERMIAPIEADDTASTRAYTVGQRLIVNEVLYKATDAIAIGDALVVGTNIEADDNVTTQLETKYDTSDSASTTINDTDYVPLSESGGTKKKTLWSTLVEKIKTALGISSSGSTYLKKDGTWGTPTNTTYTFATGDSNGQIKVTPSGGSAQNVDVKGLGSAAFTASSAYAASSHTHNYAGSSSAGGAANYLTYMHTNEINFKGGTQNTCYFNYRNAETDSGDSNNKAITYKFCNYTSSTGKSDLQANSFNGVKLATSGSSYGYYDSSGNFKSFRQPTGNATAAQVVSGYTFSNASSDGLTGSIPNNGSNKSATYVSANTVRFPSGYYTYQQVGSDYLNPFVSLTDAQAKNVLSHTATATPTGSDRNKSAYNLGQYHNYRYVNTKVCYDYGWSDGSHSGQTANKYYGQQTWSGQASSHSFTYTGLKANGRRFFFVAFVQQLGGTYTGQGTGANVTISGGTLDGTAIWQQDSCQSDNTSGLGGMVIRTCQAFTQGSGTSVTLNLNIAANLTGLWICYLWGNY